MKHFVFNITRVINEWWKKNLPNHNSSVLLSWIRKHDIESVNISRELIVEASSLIVVFALNTEMDSHWLKRLNVSERNANQQICKRKNNHRVKLTFSKRWKDKLKWSVRWEIRICNTDFNLISHRCSSVCFSSTLFAGFFFSVFFFNFNSISNS